MGNLRALALIGTVLCAGPAAATPQWPDPQAVSALLGAVRADLADPQGTADTPLRRVDAALALTTTPATTGTVPAASAITGTGTVAMGDLQIAMTQLSVAEGTNNQLRVLQAQGGQRDAIFISGGAMTLQELADQAAAQGIAGVTRVDGAVRLTRPLILWPGAALSLQPGDVLDLAAEGGAFLLSFGRVDLAGATIRTRAIGGPETFRPFVLVSGEGTLVARDSLFVDLGMAGAYPFGGIMVSSRGLFKSDVPPYLAHNRFDGVGSLAISGVVGAVVEANRFDASRGTALTLSAVTDAQVSGNLILGTVGSAGIKVGDGADGLHLTGNVIAGGRHNGISLSGNSTDIDIRGNLVLDNGGSGLSADRVTCVEIADNAILHSGQSGVRLQTSGAARISGNALAGNAGTGVVVNAQPAATAVEVTANLLAANRVGVAGAAIGRVTLGANDLTGQLPRLFDGEFAQHLPGYLTAAEQDDARLFRIAADGTDPAADVLRTCKQKG